MRHACHRYAFVIAALLVPLATSVASLVAKEAADASDQRCAAETPVPNPWTKKLPQGWWLKRHEEILAAPGRAEAQMVFIGDSITDGWDNEGGGLKIWEKEYVPRKALNLGIICDSTQHALWRLDNGELSGLSNLKLAVVMIGTNNQGITRDSPEDTAKGVAAICGRVQEKTPQAKILVLGIFPKGFGAEKHLVANELISKLDDGKQVFYLNINDELIDGKGIADRVGHLNEKGYQIWADAMRPKIEKLMQ